MARPDFPLNINHHRLLRHGGRAVTATGSILPGVEAFCPDAAILPISNARF